MGFGSKVLDFFTGGVGSKVLDIGDDLIDTQSERREDDAVDLKDARSMQTDSHAGKLVGLYKTNTSPAIGLAILFLILIDVLVDAAARLVRPWVTIHLLGAFFGYWILSPVTLTPFQESMVYLVFTFWFGGRAIMKDIPQFLKALRVYKKK
jgi:hypothetical protein